MFKTDAFKTIESGNLKTIRSLLKKKPDIIHKLKNGDTLLHTAAQMENSSTMQVLLQHGANVNRHNSAGRTALHISCALGDYNGIVVLTEHDADPSAKCPSGNTPFHEAVKKGNLRTIKYLFNYNVNINVQNRDGWSALHSSVSCNRIDAAEVLLQHGIDAELRNKKGLRAYEMAIDLMHHDMAELISKSRKKPALALCNLDDTVGQSNVMVSKIGNIFESGKRNIKEIFPWKKRENIEQEEEMGSFENEGTRDGNIFLITQQKLKSLIVTKQANEAMSSSLTIDNHLEEKNDPNVETLSSPKNVAKSPESPENVQCQQEEIQQRNEKSTRFRNFKKGFKFIGKKGTDHDNDVGDEDLEDAKREEEEIHECPVCFEVPLAPVHVYQCSNGHLYCGNCKDMPNMFNCPQCGVDIVSCRTRNRYAEEIIDRLYGGDKTKKN